MTLEGAFRARGRLPPLWATIMISVATVAGSATDTSAIPLTPFRHEAQAQRHCPADVVVWLDFRKGIYCSKRQRRYASGIVGSLVCRGGSTQQRISRSLLGLR
jgi:hypothetical protein